MTEAQALTEIVEQELQLDRLRQVPERETAALLGAIGGGRDGRLCARVAWRAGKRATRWPARL